MLYYRHGEQSDPFFYIFSDPGWLHHYDPPRDFPFWVNLEATNQCNLDCLFCSRQLAVGRKGFLEANLLERIIAEVRNHPGAAIRLTGWGEPLLHPQFTNFVKRIKAAGIPLKVYTNGSLLTEDMMKALVDAGLDDLQFSMQGLTPEQYEFNRRKASFRTFREKVELAAKVRAQRNSSRPFLSLLTSVLASELHAASPKLFIEHWSPLMDKIAIDLTNLNFVRDLERVKKLLVDQALSMIHRPCVDVFLAIEVKHDGLIEFCGQDAQAAPQHIIGQIPGMSIYQAWHSPKMERQRQLVGRELSHDNLVICRNCYHNTSKYDLFKEKY